MKNNKCYYDVHFKDGVDTAIWKVYAESVFDAKEKAVKEIERDFSEILEDVEIQFVEKSEKIK